MDPREREELEAAAAEVPHDLLAYYVTEQQRIELHSLLSELDKRSAEALRLYEPSPFQQQYHECLAKQCVLQKGNQAGGTLAGAIELARAVTGQDPFGKYPEKNGVAVVVGFKGDHLGDVIYKYLFTPGAFRIIKDQGQWRVFKPWLDKGRESEAKPAPPIIPARYIKDMVWEEKGKRIFKRVDFTTGWELKAFSSRSVPAQGFWANLVWFDEDLERDDWHREMVARLSMAPEKTGYKGILRWTALPHNKNDALSGLVELAEDELGKPNPVSVCIRATIFDNPFMDDETKEENVKTWRQYGEDEYRKRALGEMTNDSVWVYPEFSKYAHAAVRNPPRDAELDNRPAVVRILTESGGVPPHDWCRYLVTDPGFQVCANVYIAVPPPDLGDYMVAYDLDYIRDCDAETFGQRVAEKRRDQTFQAFYIDMHGGRLRDIASGLMPHEQYAAALARHGVASVETGSRFRPGCPETTARRLKLHSALHVRADGTPKLLVVLERCKELELEFRRYKKKIIQGVITDETNDRTPNHAIHCLEYAAAADLKYVPPPPRRRQATLVDQMLAAKKRRQAKAKARNYTPGQSAVSLGPQGASK